MDDGAEAADAEPANALVPASCGNEIRASAPHGGARIRCEYPLRTTLNIDEKPTNLDENEAFEFDDISRKMFSRVELQRFHKSGKNQQQKMKQERSLSPRRVSTQSLRCGHLGVRATPSEECLSRTQHKHCKSQLACDEPRSQHDEEALRTAVIDIQQLRLASRETTPFDAVNTAPKLRSGLPKSLASKRRQLVPIASTEAKLH